MQVVVVSFLTADHSEPEVNCQWVACATPAGKARVVREINEFLDSVSEYSDEELAAMELTKLSDFDNIAAYIGEYAAYFKVDVTYHEFDE